MRRWFLVLTAVLVLLVVALPAALFYYLAYTEPGLRLVASRIPERIGRTQLRLGAVSGTLAGGLRLERLEIEHERAHLRFETVQGRLALAPLLLQTLRAPELSVGRLDVEVGRGTRPPPQYEPRFLPRWLSAQVDRGRIGAGTLTVPSGRRFDLTEVTVTGVARHKTIRFYQAAFGYEDTRIAGTAMLRAANPLQLAADARITRRTAGQPPWTIAASAEGDLDVLGIEARFTAPFRADFEGAAVELTGLWGWWGSAVIRDFDLRTWGGGGALGRITGELALRGDIDGFEAHGALTPEGLQAGPFDASFQGAYGGGVLTADRIEIRHHGSGGQLGGAGRIEIAPRGPRLALSGNWRGFRWPLVGPEITVRSALGEYSLAGTLPYALRASGEIEVADFATLPAQIDGTLGSERLLIARGEVGALGGRASLTGEVSWSPSETWSVKGRATGVDPATIRPDLPGRLDFAFEASGQEFGAGGTFALELRDLGGRLRGVAASGGGKVARSAAGWQFERVRIGLGRTDLSLDGRIAEQLDLRFAVHAEDLSLLAAESRGQLQARGSLRGTLREPVIDATASGSGIRHRGVALRTLQATIDFDARQMRPARIDVQARDLTLQERQLERVSFRLDGITSDHLARLEVQAPGLALASEATGRFAAGVWQGDVRRLDVDGTDALRLSLQAPASLLVSADAARIGRFCLEGKPARLCADAHWTPARWFATVESSDLPIGTLTAGLTPGIEYRGLINIEGRAFAAAGEPVQGALRADLTDALLAYRRPSGRVDSIRLGSGTVTVDARPELIEAEMEFDARQIGTVGGRLVAQRTTGSWREMPLRGSLRAQTAELGFVSLYVPQIDRSAGRLLTDLVISGTPGAPIVDGIIRLSEAELDFYQVNLALRQLTLDARLLNNGVDFSTTARIGRGQVKASGLINWRGALPYGRINLDGSNLRVVDLPEAEIDASPDLDFHIDGRRIEVTGTVKVPFARIEPMEITGAVRASADEIVAGEEAASAEERFKVQSTVTLSLGERVSIDTYGLTGRLTGNLTVRSGYEEITRGSGELDVQDGRYTAYGRRLDVERGRLIFTGGPINDPGVDIRAVKRYPDVVAGINVRGTLLQPRLTFFSEPSLPQSQIVSLILAGGSLASVQESPTGVGTNQRGARNELLAQGGAILAQQLGQRVGIEDVGIESNLDNETSLVLGKFLSPKLYVSYGISLTESLNTLKLRYSLGDRWTIRSEIGQARGVDLVYTIDK